MLVHNPNFNIKQIADSGQCFRMNKLEGKDKTASYSLVAYGKYLELTQVEEDTVELDCPEEEFHQLWEDYFDLKYDYGKVIEDLSAGEDEFLKQAAAYGSGVRILQQEPFEAAISFIISQNKNIPAIRSCVEALCRSYGESRRNKKGEVYYAFPAPGVLACIRKEELRALGMGYRDEYILRAAQAVADRTINFDHLKKDGYEHAVKALKTIKGIGEKVANCISLYGLHHIEGFPVDVWIRRILKDIYRNEFNMKKYSCNAGIIQQYMFYYYRHLKGIS